MLLRSGAHGDCRRGVGGSILEPEGDSIDTWDAELCARQCGRWQLRLSSAAVARGDESGCTRVIILELEGAIITPRKPCYPRHSIQSCHSCCDHIPNHKLFTHKYELLLLTCVICLLVWRSRVNSSARRFYMIRDV